MMLKIMGKHSHAILNKRVFIEISAICTIDYPDRYDNFKTAIIEFGSSVLFDCCPA